MTEAQNPWPQDTGWIVSALADRKKEIHDFDLLLVEQMHMLRR